MVGEAKSPDDDFQHCIVGLLSKMAVDRTLNSSLADAREAFINVCVDAIERWAKTLAR